MAPAHATVVSILAKFRIPGTSSLTTCAFAAAAIRLATVNSASVGIAGCMPAPPLDGGAYHCCRWVSAAISIRPRCNAHVRCCRPTLAVIALPADQPAPAGYSTLGTSTLVYLDPSA